MVFVKNIEQMLFISDDRCVESTVFAIVIVKKKQNGLIKPFKHDPFSSQSLLKLKVYWNLSRATCDSCHVSRDSSWQQTG